MLIEDFLSEFWDYEKSPYVKELALEGKILSRSHVKNERSRIENYWIPELKGMTIGSFTNEILKQIVSKRKIQSLAGKTLMVLLNLSLPRSNGQSVINTLITFLLMDLNAIILKAKKVMAADWQNDKAKLANKLAMRTGMRASEIRGLRICDVQADGVHVDHAWDRYARDNKCCKNGEARALPIPISKELRDELIMMGKLNPFCNTDEAYIFWSDR